MALLALFNGGGGTSALFSPYGGTHNEAPKRKNVAPLACRQSEAIVEEGMGPDDYKSKISAGYMSKQGAKRRGE